MIVARANPDNRLSCRSRGVGRSVLGAGLWMAAAAAVLVPGMMGAGAAGETAATEGEVRAAFLFQLAQYVHWPQTSFGGPGTPLRFCVLDQDGLYATLERIVAGKSIQGRPIVVAKVAGPGQLGRCHLVYIGYQNEKQLRDMLAGLRAPGLLTAGEAKNFAAAGGMVNLILESGRVSFEVNLGAAQRGGLEFRSQLLRFARLVDGGRGARP
jgi:hypothetical protein